MGLYETRVERLAKWAGGEKAGPVSIELVPTERCNLNCLSCWRQGWDKKKLEERYSQEMSDKRLLKLIDEAAEIGVKEIAFVGGGEPLFRSITPKLIRKIKEYRMECDLVTNGALLTKELTEEMVKIGVDRVKFSIDGVNVETHDYLRGVKGTFKKVMGNIEYFSKMKASINTKNPRLLFNTVISKKNYKQLPDIVKLGNSVDLNGIWLLPLTVFDESAKGLKLTHEQTIEFKSILKEAITLSKEFGMDSNFEHFLDTKYMEKTESMHEVMMEEVKSSNSSAPFKNIIKKEYPKSEDSLENFKFLPCYIPWHHITIIPNGNMAPCFSPWVWDTDVSIKNHSLKELWYGEYFDKFRSIMLNRKLPNNCKRCCVWEVFNNKKIREGLERLIKVDN